jgi:hypothetical protein
MLAVFGPHYSKVCFAQKAAGTNSQKRYYQENAGMPMTPPMSGFRGFQRRLATASVAVVALAAFWPQQASAQWLKYKTPGIPRTADGKPDLTAALPRMADGKPDLSGIWRTDMAGLAESGKAQGAVKAQPWAAELTAKRKENLGNDSPSVRCLPDGITAEMGVGKMVQTPGLIVMLWGSTLYRQIFLDGRDLPVDPNPTWMGYSVGHWEGDTLVISTAGFNDRTWLDGDGHPHTEGLRVTERLHRTDFGHMEIIRTFADAGALLEPWTVPVKLELDPDNEGLEYVCNENERDAAHLVGKASDDKDIKIAPAILAKYVGHYEVKLPATGEKLNITFALDKDHLTLSGVGPTETLKAGSETEFSAPGLNLKFEKGKAGKINDVLIQTVEGDFKGIRK